MTAQLEHVQKALNNALSGTGAHVKTATVFEDLDWKLAGVRPGPGAHTIYEELCHMIFWQDWVVRWLNGRNPAIPPHAGGSWPRSSQPASRREWDRTVRHCRDGLTTLARRSGASLRDSTSRTKSRLEMLHTIASHNSYHAGQVVLLRQLFNAWPSSSGGLTW